MGLQMLETKGPLLNSDQSKLFRSSVMRAAYLSQNRPDISHAVKNLARRMVNPTEANLIDLKRLVRFLKKYPDFGQTSSEQKMPTSIRADLWLQERVSMAHLNVDHVEGEPCAR